MDRRTPAALLATCAALAVSLAACSAPPSPAVYLGDSAGGSYARVPAGWTSFAAGEFLSKVHQADAEPVPGQAVHAFAADGSLESVLSGGDSLAGLLEVRPVPGPLSRDQLLDMIFGNVSQLAQEGKAAVFSVAPAEPGEVAVRVEMNVGETPSVFLQRSMMLPDGRARVFVIGCSAACFARDSSTAEQAFATVTSSP